jgi:hypothetical protein
VHSFGFDISDSTVVCDFDDSTICCFDGTALCGFDSFDGFGGTAVRVAPLYVALTTAACGFRSVSL